MQAVSDGSFRIVYVAKGEREGRRGSDFFSNLKTVVHIGYVALDKSVPTPLPLRRYLRHINR